ncbi:MAG TPA: hypothetical protein VJ546_12680 [Bacillales bacterium]|nr:hypothetical protein [Bacillales bacterium]
MNKIMIDSYKLDRISTRMAKNFGTIPKGQEDRYAYILSAMEGNLMKLHRQDPNRSGRRALTAIQMALLTVDGYIKQVEYDFSSHAIPENQALLHGLLMSFDPFTNREVRGVVMEETNSFDANKYFEIPIKCLLRIEKSIKLWTNDLGPNGYFTFIENHMGHMIERDDKMNFAILAEERKI